MTIFAASTNSRTFDYQAGDIGYVPAGFGMSHELTIHTPVPPRRLPLCYDVGHYLENTGNTTLHFLEIFDTGRFPSNVSRFLSTTHGSERGRSFPGYQSHSGTVE